MASSAAALVEPPDPELDELRTGDDALSRSLGVLNDCTISYQYHGDSRSSVCDPDTASFGIALATTRNALF